MRALILSLTMLMGLFTQAQSFEFSCESFDFSNDVAQYNVSANKIVVHGITFDYADNRWSAPVATLPSNVESFVVRNNVKVGRYFRWDLVITYNDDETPTFNRQEVVINWNLSGNLQERKQSGFNAFFIGRGATHEAFDKHRFYVN